MDTFQKDPHVAHSVYFSNFLAVCVYSSYIIYSMYNQDTFRPFAQALWLFEQTFIKRPERVWSIYDNYCIAFCCIHLLRTSRFRCLLQLYGNWTEQSVPLFALPCMYIEVKIFWLIYGLTRMQRIKVTAIYGLLIIYFFGNMVVLVSTFVGGKFIKQFWPSE
jgi:hypothetical protein